MFYLSYAWILCWTLGSPGPWRLCWLLYDPYDETDFVLHDRMIGKRLRKYLKRERKWWHFDISCSFPNFWQPGYWESFRLPLGQMSSHSLLWLSQIFNGLLAVQRICSGFQVSFCCKPVFWSLSWYHQMLIVPACGPTRFSWNIPRQVARGTC